MQNFRMSFAGVQKGEKSMKKAQDLSFWEKPCACVSYVIFSL